MGHQKKARCSFCKKITEKHPCDFKRANNLYCSLDCKYKDVKKKVICWLCKKSKNRNQFYWWRAKKDNVLRHSFCKPCCVIYSRDLRSKPKRRKYERERKQKIRLEALKHYSGGKIKCVCCGEKEISFLAIDHINGGGTKMRREKNLAGYNLCAWLKKKNYPSGYQILCHNCNMAKGFYGVCPHIAKHK